MKVEEAEIDTINAKLAERFGLCYDSRPIYRLVWSEDEFEWREGIYPFFGLNDRQVITHAKDTRYVKKYKFLDPPRYVLEKLAPRILPEIKGNEKLYYEICMPLPENKPPYWEGIEFFIAMGEVTSEEEEKQFAEKYYERLKKEDGEKEVNAYNYAMELLNDESDSSERHALSLQIRKPDSLS